MRFGVFFHFNNRLRLHKKVQTVYLLANDIYFNLCYIKNALLLSQVKVHTDFIIKDDKICGFEINHKEKFTASDVFLGIGHSARDTYELLYSKGISMEAKPFAIGVRIEHPQDLIDKAQYGEDYKSELLPVADYSLTYNNRQKGRSILRIRVELHILFVCAQVVK